MKLNQINRLYTIILKNDIVIPLNTGIYIDNFIHLQHITTLLPNGVYIDPMIRTIIKQGDADLFYSYLDGVVLCNINNTLYLTKGELISRQHHAWNYYLKECLTTDEQSNFTILRLFREDEPPAAVYGKDYFFAEPFGDLASLGLGVELEANTSYAITSSLSGLYEIVGQCIRLFGCKGHPTYNGIKELFQQTDNPVVVFGRAKDNSVFWNISEYNEAVFAGIPRVDYNFV